jgi:CPA2 family monovalent cation:H+ antiporter-2
VIRKARRFNPGVRVVARCAYMRDRASLRQAGADEVFSGEGEIALGMTESVLTALGASAEQIDRERASLRKDLSDDRAAPPAPS